MDRLCSVAGDFHGDAAARAPDPYDKSCSDLGSVAKSLLFCFEERPEVWKPWEAGPRGGGGGQCPPGPGRTDSPRGEGRAVARLCGPLSALARRQEARLRDSAAVSTVAL